ncbi:hypothetical protein [Halobellus salinisoli]|uniref:hypothetical protein n=1 Tax=Halobellus salinisoli TaxID=3108500 RepID=UPI00300AFDA0
METREVTTISKPPAVIDVDVVGDHVLATAERGDIATVVKRPVGTDGEKVDELLDDAPEKIETVAGPFAGGE